MTKFRLTAIALVLMLASAVFAQSYRIRTDAEINLRSTYSLEGDIVERVAAGTVLEVAGQFGQWLKINRNGGTVWMAAWVHHTRLSDGQAASSQAAQPAQSAPPAANPQPTAQPQDTDNKCFEGWVCTTEQDWIDGWFAKQAELAAGSSAGQSAPPVQPVQSAPAQPTAQPQDTDNKCFEGWVCTTEQDWIDGWFAKQAELAAGSGASSAGQAVQPHQPAQPVQAVQPTPTVQPSQPAQQIHGTLYEFSGVGNRVVDGVVLARGQWKSVLTTNDFGIVTAVPPIDSTCLWRYLPGEDKTFNNKSSAAYGGGTQDSAVETVWSDCTVSIEIDVDEAWSLRLEKLDFSQPVPQTANGVYEFGGFGTRVIDALALARGQWKSVLTTNDFGIVTAVPPIDSTCLWRYLPGEDKTFNNKSSAAYGGGTQDSAVETVWSDCTVALEINVNEAWTLRLEKVG